MKISLTIGAVLGPALGVLASSAGADVTILSRESVAAAYSGSLNRVDYDERETFSGAGLFDVVLPHRYAHRDLATAAGFEGFFAGESQADRDALTSSSFESSMVVRFLVSGSPASMTLDFLGESFGGFADNFNVTLRLDNLTTGARAFDLARDGVRSSDPGESVIWNHQLFTTDLQVGIYELTVRAHGNYTSSGGGHSSGLGELSMSMTAVPTPGALAMLAITPLAHRRRR